MHPRPAVATLLVTLAALGAPPTTALAHGGAASLGDPREVVLTGVESGLVGAGDDLGFTLGLETSWTHSRDLRWRGVLAQLRYESDSEALALAVGVEGGMTLFGADLSAVARLGEVSSVGVRARGCVSLMLVGVCAGATVGTGGMTPELTTTLKVPLEFQGRTLPPWRWRGRARAGVGGEDEGAAPTW